MSVILAGIFLAGSLTGCSGSGNTEETVKNGDYQIISNATLGGEWHVYQLRLDIPVNGEFDIDFLGLDPGDQVDGYFYVEKNEGITLEIDAGTNQIYEYVPNDADTTLGSDRFSFTATEAAGTAYVMLFGNSGEKSIEVMVEIVFPLSAQLRGPLELQ